MGRGESEAVKKAAQYLAKKPDAKPIELAVKFGLSVSTIYRQKWWKDHQAQKAQKPQE